MFLSLPSSRCCLGNWIWIQPISHTASLNLRTLWRYKHVHYLQTNINLSVLSNTLERIVAHQLIDYSSAADLLAGVHYLPFSSHDGEGSAESSSGYSSCGGQWPSGNLAVLTLLDLSAVFDTVDHETLLNRLKISYGLGGRAHVWFQSYLSGLLAVEELHLFLPCSFLWSPSRFISWTHPLPHIHCLFVSTDSKT